MTGAKALPRFEHQKRVDAHHQALATYWRDIYEHDGLDAVICQQRREVVLTSVERLAIPEGERFLEVGCGAGITTVDLARRGYRVQAVDTVTSMLEFTGQAAREAGVADRVSLSRTDAHSLPFTGGTFRVALLMGVTTCLHSLGETLSEMARVLQPGGYLLVNAENRWRLNHMLDPLLFPALAPLRHKVRDALAASDKPRLQMYSIKEFNAALKAAGLTKVQGMTLGFGPFTLFNRTLLPERAGVKLNNHLQKMADRGVPMLRSTGVQYMVVAQKGRR